MKSSESIYKRLSLQVNCSSSSLASSYLEGRVNLDEKFEKDGKIFTLEQILLSDDVFSGMVKDAFKDKPSPKAQGKYDSLPSRIELFNKIVLLGDDSLFYFILENEKNQERITKQEGEIKLLKEEVTSLQNKKNALNGLCTSVAVSLEDLSIILSGFKDEFDDNSLYAKIVQMENSVLSSFNTNLKKEIKLINRGNVSGKIKEVDLIKKLQKENDKAINSANKKIIALKESAIAEIQEKCDIYSTFLTHAGEYVDSVKKLSSNLFSPSKRIFKFPDIPQELLIKAILNVGGDVAPNNVIAFYDASLNKTGSSGILVTLYGIYFFDRKECKKYFYHRNNSFEVNSEKCSEYSCTGRLIFILIVLISAIIFCIGIGVEGLSIAIPYVLISLLGVRRKKNRITIQRRENVLLRFFTKKDEGIKNFIDDINFICASCVWSSKDVEAIKKVIY